MKHIIIGIMVGVFLWMTPEPLKPATYVTPVSPPKKVTPEIARKDILKAFIETRNKSVDSEYIAALLVDMADEYQHDYAIVAAVAATESNFDPKAKNTRCSGLLQIHDIWIPELKREGFIRNKHDLFVPWRNARSGCYILRKYRNDSFNIYVTLLKYNGKVDDRNPYLPEVMAHYMKLTDKPMVAELQ